jgi:hypothetical protein
MGLWALLWFSSAIVLGALSYGVLLIPVWIASGVLANDL